MKHAAQEDADHCTLLPTPSLCASVDDLTLKTNRQQRQEHTKPHCTATFTPTSDIKVKVNINNACFTMSEAVTMPSLMMMSS